LALLALEAAQLAAAEAAFSALDMADRLAWVRGVQRISSCEGRAAELLAYKGQTGEAEALLLKVRVVLACRRASPQGAGAGCAGSLLGSTRAAPSAFPALSVLSVWWRGVWGRRRG
jgi:hypothetical protein